MVNLIKTTSQNADFRSLEVRLDQDLKIRDGEDHAFYAQFNKSDTIREVLVAYQADQPVGCGAFKPWQEGIAEIKRMYVDPAFRGQGIASTILKELEQWAAALQYQSCILETGINQPEAIALYKKMGYTVIPNYGQYEGVETSVCMQKSLAK